MGKMSICAAGLFLGLALVLGILAQSGWALGIQGRVVDHEGTPIQGIPVSFQEMQDTTDSNGDYRLDSTAGVVDGGVTWGSIKALYKNEPRLRLSQTEAAAPRAVTDTLFTNCGAERDTTYWSAACLRTVSGDLVFNAVLPSFTVTIPNGPDLQGPMQAQVTPVNYKDIGDIIPDGYYMTIATIDPRDLPRVTFADYYQGVSEELWNAMVLQNNKWEQMTGYDFYDHQEYGFYPDDYPYSGEWIALLYGSPAGHVAVGSEGWVYQSWVYLDTTIPHIVNHEAGFHALGRFRHVTTFGPYSLFNANSSDPQPKDAAVMKLIYDIKTRFVMGQNDVVDFEYR